MSNQDWQDNFRRRCENVGWTVTRTNSSHFKVHDGERFLFTYSGTASDRRALLNVLSLAKRAGIEQLETQVKLRNERDRLARIERDRASVPVIFKEPEMAAEPKPSDDQPDLGSVDGVAIVAVAQAMFQTPVMPSPGPLSDAQELLLADESVVFRCVKPAATLPATSGREGICHRTFKSVNSVQAHIRFHSHKSEKEVPPVTPAVKPNKVTVRSKSTKSEVAAESTQTTRSDVEKLAERVTDTSDRVGKLITGLQDIILEMSSINHDLAKLQVADAETIDKANQFDALRSIFKG